MPHPTDYQCWIGNNLVKTVNSRDLAKKFQSRMAALGSSVEIKAVKMVRRAA